MAKKTGLGYSGRELWNPKCLGHLLKVWSWCEWNHNTSLALRGGVGLEEGQNGAFWSIGQRYHCMTARQGYILGAE